MIIDKNLNPDDYKEELIKKHNFFDVWKRVLYKRKDSKNAGFFICDIWHLIYHFDIWENTGRKG